MSVAVRMQSVSPGSVLAVGRVIGMVLDVVVLAIALLVVFRPLWPASGATTDLPPRARLSYDGAVADIRVIQSKESADDTVNPVCRTELWTHGVKTARSVVLLHGFASCPAQYAALGKRLYELGFNVYVPRMPHHGLRDVMTSEQAELSPAEVEAYGMAAVDVGAGLGDQVVLVGLSGGGAVASALAQARHEVSLAVLVSPLVGVAGLPAFATRPIANLAMLLPNTFVWRDGLSIKISDDPAYAYPRFASRGLGALLALSSEVQDAAATARPAAGEIRLVLNDADPSVSRTAAKELARKWRAMGANVDEYVFPTGWHLPHDLIDPSLPDQQITRVYPVLERLVSSDH